MLLDKHEVEVVILASGSKGNALIIKYEQDFILVDIGISFLSLNNKLKALNLDIEKINRLLITHEHSDHIKGLKTFLKRRPNVELIMTNKTLKSLDNETKQLINKVKIITQEESFKLHDISVNSFALSHDAAEPVGFKFIANKKSIVLATDTGYIDESYFNLLKNADLYILESNHCPEILMDSNRHFYLKQRILSDTGHLSNNEASWLMNEFVKEIESTKWAIAHISEDCNTQYKIERAIVKIINEPSKIEVIYTSQETSEVIKL